MMGFLHWLSECDTPLSIHSHKLPESDALSIQNDSPDPTYQDCWPSERYPSDGPERAVGTTESGTCCADQCDECRAAPGQPHATGCDEAAKVTDSVINVASCPECGSVTDIDYGPASVLLPKRESGAEEETLSVPLWKQALWLARHIEDLHSPRPDVLNDDELRGMTLIRVLGIGADEHGDEVFRKDSPGLRRERAEEWSDGEFYDLVDRFGDDLVSPATASQDEDTALCGKGLESCFESAGHDGVAGTVAT